jgi:hypothetical protein
MYFPAAPAFILVRAEPNLGHVERRPSGSVYIQNDLAQLCEGDAASSIYLYYCSSVWRKRRE